MLEGSSLYRVPLQRHDLTGPGCFLQQHMETVNDTFRKGPNGHHVSIPRYKYTRRIKPRKGTKAGTKPVQKDTKEQNEHLVNLLHIAHWMAVATMAGVGLIGVWTHGTNWVSNISSTTGILISVVVIWHLVKAWEDDQLIGASFQMGFVLYAVAVLEEFLGAIAKWKGGGFADFVYNGYLPFSVIVMLSCIIALFLMRPSSIASREDRALDIEDDRQKRLLASQDRMDRIAKRREDLRDRDLNRRKRRGLKDIHFTGVMARLENWRVKRKIKKLAASEVDLTIDLVLGGHIQKLQKQVDSSKNSKTTSKAIPSESNGTRKKRKLPGRPSEFCPGVGGEECGEPITKRQSRCKKCKRRATYLRSKGELTE